MLSPWAAGLLRRHQAEATATSTALIILDTFLSVLWVYVGEKWWKRCWLSFCFLLLLARFGLGYEVGRSGSVEILYFPQLLHGLLAPPALLSLPGLPLGVPVT